MLIMPVVRLPLALAPIMLFEKICTALPVSLAPGLMSWGLGEEPLPKPATDPVAELNEFQP